MSSTYSRRDFLKGLGLTAGLVLASPSLDYLVGNVMAEENQNLTPQQKENLEKFGYPWDDVTIHDDIIEIPMYLCFPKYEENKGCFETLREKIDEFSQYFRDPQKIRQFILARDSKNGDDFLFAFGLRADGYFMGVIRTKNKNAPRGIYRGLERFSNEKLEILRAMLNLK